MPSTQPERLERLPAGELTNTDSEPLLEQHDRGQQVSVVTSRTRLGVDGRDDDARSRQDVVDPDQWRYGSHEL